jgi:predicted RNA-binding Zn-ribbon protein involved in translation (DUF1610 family)
MSDFITSSCPSCGGQLEVSPTTLTLVCQHCGAENMVLRKRGKILLESFAQCPVCNRNDEVRKVAGIVKSEGELARSLYAPPRPDKEKGCGSFFFGGWCSVFAILMIVFFSLGAFANPPNALLIIGGIIGLLLFGIPTFLLFRDGHETNRRGELKYPDQISRWEAATIRWNSSYFCKRDNIIFIPNSGEFFDINRYPTDEEFEYRYEEFFYKSE